MRKLHALFVPVAVLALSGPLAAQTPSPKPLRTLTYSFTYGTLSDVTKQSAGINVSAGDAALAGGNVTGMDEYKGHASDRGTITVVVKSLAKDGGLVVSISEKARGTRNAEPATCVAYHDSSVLCDPQKKVTEEEYALLRFIGKDFIDATQIDAKGNWSTTSRGTTNVTNAFHIESAKNGLLSLTETRTISQKGVNAFTTTIDGKITYNVLRTVPDSIFEQAITRSDNGMNGNKTMNTQIQLNLKSDSDFPS